MNQILYESIFAYKIALLVLFFLGSLLFICFFIGYVFLVKRMNTKYKTLLRANNITSKREPLRYEDVFFPKAYVGKKASPKEDNAVNKKPSLFFKLGSACENPTGSF